MTAFKIWHQNGVSYEMLHSHNLTHIAWYVISNQHDYKNLLFDEHTSSL